MAVPLGTLGYGELVAMLYAPGIIAILILLVAAVRHRRAELKLPKR